jgi:hypothetical protein
MIWLYHDYRVLAGIWCLAPEALLALMGKVEADGLELLGQDGCWPS